MKTDFKCALSVVIVNYNTMDFLARCLNSVASQADVDSEVIVVDNCSQDIPEGCILTKEIGQEETVEPIFSKE